MLDRMRNETFADIDVWYLTGLLLNYPECCIKWFCEGNTVGNPNAISYEGFCPCEEHQKLSRAELEELVGRSFNKEPPEIWQFKDYNSGLKVYAAIGKADFFKGCWERAKAFMENS